MAYVVFDLDQTLADLTVVYPFLDTLCIKEHILDHHPYMMYFFPSHLEDELEEAYPMFVQGLLNEELATEPLGLLRPGILPIMAQLYKMKRKGHIKGLLMYSNNSHLPSLILVKDIIELHVGGTLFTDCIHWNHPMRGPDTFNPYVMKSWEVLSRIMREGPTQAPCTLSAHQVFFFDDMRHVDLEKALSEQYYHVPAYQGHPSTDRLNALYTRCVQDAHVSLFPFMRYLVDLFELENVTIRYNPAEATMEGLLQLLQQIFTRFKIQKKPALTHDTGLQMMQDMMETITYHYKMKKRTKRITWKSRRYTVKKHK